MKNCRCGSPRCLPRERWLAVLRPDGIRSACVGQPLHSRRSALSRDARKLNLKIKFRESFRPFAPAVMRDRVGHYFELEQSSPYMLLVAPVKPAIRRPTIRSEPGRIPRSVEDAALLHSCCDACRLFRTRANGEPRRKSAFLFFTGRVRGADRLRSAGQHFSQRAGRTTGLHAGRSVPLFHAHGHGFSGT